MAMSYLSVQRYGNLPCKANCFNERDDCSNKQAMSHKMNEFYLVGFTRIDSPTNARKWARGGGKIGACHALKR